MLSVAEVKANMLYYVARYVGEPILARSFLPPYQEIGPDSPPIDKADVFNIAAQKAFSKLRGAIFRQQEADTLVDLAQQAINGSRFKQAREIVGNVRNLARELPDLDQKYFQAQAHVKLGWVADYETGYGNAVSNFENARRLLEEIGRERWGEKHHSLFSTTTHFMGRARLGLACQGIDTQNNIQLAQSFFRADLDHFRILRKQGNPQPANEGFQHLWLATSFLTANNSAVAMHGLDEAGRFFDEYLVDNPKSGIKAHWYLLNGLLELKENHPEVARGSFLQAVNIRTQVESYPRGLALAEMGIAKTYFRERQYISALTHMKKAVQTNPAVLLYAVNGRIGS